MCHCTTLELNTRTHKGVMQISPSEKVYSRVSVGTWVAQATELCYDEVSVIEQLQGPRRKPPKPAFYLCVLHVTS